MNNNYGVPPIVVEQTVEQENLESLDEHQLDARIDQAVNSRSQNLLVMGEILYILNENGGYARLGSGYQSLNEYVKDKLDRSSAWTMALIRVHKKFQKDLEVPLDELATVGYPKLSKVASITTAENVDEILERCRNSTQQELADYVKAQNGDVEATESDEVQHEIRLKGSETNMGGILTAFETARQEYADNYNNVEASSVSDFQAMEIICATYTTSRSLDFDTDQSIQQTLDEFARANNLQRIQWERNVE